MQNQDRQTQAPGLKLADIYYILFRHKWKIILLSVAGFLAAVVVYFVEPPAYTSEAKLFIRYILESRLPSGIAGTDPQVKTLDTGGANIINSEIEIIRSLDLAVQVAEAIGPEKILGKGSIETNKYAAAVVLQKGLSVEVPPRSDILRIVFTHPNREIVKPVLSLLIDDYLIKHVEIHRNVGAYDDVLTKQTDALRSQLALTEQALQSAKTNAGVMSIEDSKKAYTEEISKIRQDLFNTQAELAMREAAFAERQKLLPVKTETPSAKPETPVPSGKLEEYKSICGRLDSFRKQEQGLLAQYTEENPMVRGIREQIASVEKTQKKLEADYPQLTRIQLASSQPVVPVVDLSADAAQITALQAKLKVLNLQMEQLTAEAKTLNEREPTITDLQRKRDLEAAKYAHFTTSLEQAHFDDLLGEGKLGEGKMSNISVAQAPSPAFRESRKLIKTLSMIAIGGIVAGFGLAFLIELFLDPTVRRATEVEARLHLPLFLTIPRMGRSARLALPAPAVPAAGQPGAGDAGADSGTRKKDEVAAWHANGLATYYEALRDRLVTFFEVHNLVHKPKLVAVTGCGRGVGVTTVAAGLAASLSETGDGNVLLVDMTAGPGAAHPFFKGKPGIGLAEALGSETRDNAMVQENLYAVAERGNGGRLPRILPKRFGSLMPMLKASDYDYIIFDMPPVSQISVTPRLAGFMDTVLLVIESEKTDRDVVKRATAMLAESKANVCAVLNKHRDYVPKRLSQDL